MMIDDYQDKSLTIVDPADGMIATQIQEDVIRVTASTQLQIDSTLLQTILADCSMIKDNEDSIHAKVAILKILNTESMPLIRDTVEIVRSSTTEPITAVSAENLSKALTAASELLSRVAQEYTTVSEAV